jgi:uncharacterized protein (TIGR00730 family)
MEVRMQRLCVFCGSSAGNGAVYREATRQFGESLVQSGYGLVYGGGHIGLMGVLADAVLQAGGEVIGVIPRALEAKELAHTRVTRLEVVDSMHQRKARMAQLADAFVALPGGYGTLDELFEVLTWAQLGIHAKPVGLLNMNGFFDPLLGWVRHASSEGFIHLQHVHLLYAATSSGELLGALARHTPRPSVAKWANNDDR